MPRPARRTIVATLALAAAAAAVVFGLRGDPPAGPAADEASFSGDDPGRRGSSGPGAAPDRPTDDAGSGDARPGPGPSAGADGAADPARARVAGVVVDDATGAPVAGADVRGSVEPPTTETLGPTEGFEASVPPVTTGPEGRFELWIRRGAAWTLGITSPTHCAASVRGTDGTDDLRIRVRAGRAVRGIVVSSIRGAPVEGAWVSADGDPPLGTPTGRDGAFTVVLDPSAPPALAARHPTHLPRRVALDGDAAKGGPDAAPVRVELTPARAVTFRAVEPRVGPELRVFWSAGLRSGTALLRRTDEPMPGTRRPAGTVGPVLIPVEAAATPATVTASVPGFLPFSTTLESPAPDGETVTVDLRLERDPAAARVELRLERPDGTPAAFAPDATLLIRRTDGAVLPPWSVERGADGTLALDGLPAAPLAIRAFTEGFGPADATVEAVAGTVTVATAKASPEARLRVRVTGTQGRRALVRILSASTGSWQPTRPRLVADPSGRARTERVSVSGIESDVTVVGDEGVTFGGLGAGRHRIEVVSPDVAATPVEVELHADREATAEVPAVAR